MSRASIGERSERTLDVMSTVLSLGLARGSKMDLFGAAAW